MKFKNNRFNSKFLIGAIILISIIGFYLRYSGIDKVSLWMDELYTIMRIQGSLSYTLLTSSDSAFPPFYYLGMNIFRSVFGTNDIALRFPSVVFGVLTITAIFWLGKELFNWKTGLIAGSLFAIYPYAINYGQEAKQYSLLWLFMVLSFLFFFRFMNKGRKSDKILYILAMIISIYSIYIGFIFLILHWICVFIIYRKKIKDWININLWIFILYLPWLFIAIKNWLARSGIQWIPEKTKAYFMNELFSLITNQSSQLGNSSNIEVGIYILFICIALITLITDKKNNEQLIILTVWIIAPFIIYFIISSIYTPLLVPRYISFIFIPFILIFSYGLSYGLEKKALRIVSIILTIILIILIVNYHIQPIKENSLKINKENWKYIFSLACDNSNEKTLTIIQSSKHVPNLNNSLFHEHYGSCIKGEILYKEELKPLPTLSKKYSQLLFIYRGYPTDQDKVIQDIINLNYTQKEKIHSFYSNIVVFN
jgi:uncharacterized membrane protein